MTESDLETAIARTGFDFRPLVSDENPDEASRAGHRRIVENIAAGHIEHPDAEPYPPLLTQAGNAAKALGRFVGSGLAVVDRAEFDRRRAICKACPHMDPEQDRCRKCGCALAVKPWSKAEKCPDDPPRW